MDKDNLCRPLYLLYFPELKAIIQPHSGEYAVRREVLENIAFPIGYGVETSHLIDVYTKFGLGAFAQTDLDKRVHENKPTQDLGRMAFGILQTFLKRLKALDMFGSTHYETTLRQSQAQDDHYEQKLIETIEEERPPMITMEEY